ncbi:MAG: hypothetical protein AB1427_09635 [Thermodesulfobacteriota bacterium]
MSHALHRYGTVENLKNDFTLFARTSRWVNREGGGPKLRKILDIILSEKPLNFGSSKYGKNLMSGLDLGEFKTTLDDAVGVVCCFSDRESFKRVLTKLKEAQIGISIVVSGLIEEVFNIAKEIDLKPHTVFLSLGIHGNKELLPDGKVLEITSMCGHGLVATKLVKSTIKKVKQGTMAVDDGAKLLAQPCPCGIFNTDRCQQLLELYLP